MTLWLVFLVMAAIAAGLLTLPLLRPARHETPRADYDIALYRRQLAEIDRDVARGVIALADAEAARAEIGRRMLAAAERRERRRATSLTTRRATAVVLAVVVPLAALALYVNLGAPMVPAQPFAARQGEQAGEQLAKLDARLAELQAKVEADPRDLESWIALARLSAAHDRYREAADAFGRAYELSGQAPTLAVDLAEALVMADRGVVGARAQELFKSAIADDPRNPRARFYLGLARVQAGDAAAGLQQWLDLAAESPPDAPWLATLNEQIAAVAQENGVSAETLERMRGAAREKAAARAEAEAADRRAGAILGEADTPPPESNAPAPPGPAADHPTANSAPVDSATAGDAAGQPPADRLSGPSEADIEAAGKLSREDQVAMARGMVDRLAERLKTHPDDLEGWRRLGRSYLVLGEPQKASEALERAVALAPRNVEVLLDYGEALLNAASPSLAPTDRLPAKFLDVMHRIYALDDHNPVALWYLGVDHAQAGRRAEAATLWTRLLERLPPGAPERAALAKRLEMLEIDRKPER